MDAEQLQMRDLTPVEPYLPGLGISTTTLFIIAAVLVLIIGGGTWMLIAHLSKKSRFPSSEPISRAAYRKAVAALAALPDDTRQAATGASIALREYLAATTGDPSLFETHEEFIARHSSLQALPETLREMVADHFARLAALKYDQPGSDAADDITAASRDLLESIHHRRAA